MALIYQHQSVKILVHYGHEIEVIRGSQLKLTFTTVIPWMAYILKLIKLPTKDFSGLD